MAINPSATYPDQTDLSDLDYPFGKAQNVAVEGDGVGWPLEKTWVNDHLGFQQALLARAGLTPSGAPDKVGASQYLAAIELLIDRARAAALALNWMPAIRTPSGTMDFSSTLRLAEAQDADYISWLVAMTGTTGTAARTRDCATWELCTQIVDGSPVAISQLHGAGYVDLLALYVGSPSQIYKSDDAGSSWSSAISTGATSTQIARVPTLNLVVAAGYNTIRTAPSDLSAFTTRTVPGDWTALTAANIVTPRDGETSAGILILPVESSTHVAFSADGTTWVDTSVASGKPVGACWHEALGLWLVLTTDGLLYSSSAPASAGWTLAATLWNPTGFRYADVVSFGREVVIAGNSIAGAITPWVGSVISSNDLSTWRAITTTPDGAESVLVRFQDRLLAAHTIEAGPYGVSIAASLRSP